MEWVEVRGDTLEAAKEEALDQLGVALEDAEFEIVQEAESRWMGLKKTEARVRARVRPTQPRSKKEAGRGRRSRNGRGAKSGGEGRSSQRGDRGQKRGGNGRGQQKQGGKSGGKGRSRDERQSDRGAKHAGSVEKSAPAAETSARQRPQQPKHATKKEPAVSEQAATDEMVPLDEQQETIVEFLEGLVSAFGLTGSVSTSLDEDVIVGSVDGEDLGLLIGPKGGTLRAIQELSRSALQRQASGRSTNRLRVDVAGYRERRRAALADFTARQAAQVKEEGIELALEPMNAADRKAVHDAVLEIEGVRSISEGEDPHRRVVLLPGD